MAALRGLCADLGYEDATTYIQSGNVVFRSADADCNRIALALEEGMAEHLSLLCSVVVISRDDLAGVIAGNPYPEETDHRCLHAVLCRDEKGCCRNEAVQLAVRRAREKASRDDAAVVGRTLYLRTPDGFGRSKLAADLLRATASDGGTARNWATIEKLASLLDS